MQLVQLWGGGSGRGWANGISVQYPGDPDSLHGPNESQILPVGAE